MGIMRRTFGRGWLKAIHPAGDAEEFPLMPLLFSPTQRGLSDLKAGEACQKQAEAVPEKPATSRLFNASKSRKSTLRATTPFPAHTLAHTFSIADAASF